MSKIKWYWIGGVVAVIVVVGFAYLLFKGPSSGGGNSLSAKLVVWGTYDDSESMVPFIADFQKKYKNVEIVYTQKSSQDYEGDLLNALAAGTGPDIFSINNDWLPKYQDKLQEAPSEIFTAKSYKDTFMDVASDDFVSENKVYAAPLSVNSLALYYNKDILGSAGIGVPAKTWDEIRQQVKLVTNRGVGSYISRSGIALGTSTNVNYASDILYLLMLQNKAVPYTADHTQPTFDQAVIDNSGNTTFPATDALSLYTSFANQNSDVYTWNTRSNYSVDAFGNNQLAYMIGYSYLKDTIDQKAPNLNYDVTYVPQPKLDQNRVNFAKYWGFAVSKQTKSSDAAWTFIEFMTQKDNLTSYYDRHPLPTSRKDMVSDQAGTDLGVFATQNLTAKSFYKNDAAKVDDIFKNLIDDITIRGRSIEDAIAIAGQKVGEIRPPQENQ